MSLCVCECVLVTVCVHAFLFGGVCICVCVNHKRGNREKPNWESNREKRERPVERGRGLFPEPAVGAGS